MFHSVLEEMYNVYTSYDLVRIFITHKEMVNTNIVVGPDYLGNINANMIINQIADVVHSNNFIPTDNGLEINITASLCMGTFRANFFPKSGEYYLKIMPQMLVLIKVGSVIVSGIMQEN